MSRVVNAFYEAIRTGDSPVLDSLVADHFCLICPTRDHVLSGVYEGKQRFFEEVTPHVFGCANPDEITFCAEHQVIVDAGEIVVAMAQNNGLAHSGERYDQLYVHIFKIRDGQIQALIECFDTALANRALWGNSNNLEPDSPAALSNLALFKGA
ncbi:MAG: nuclear transport factor 2 family protein [Luminiphilus sp.]|nr:nuclear transport factor 2 family protein [Luminiphilus sp.]